MTPLASGATLQKSVRRIEYRRPHLAAYQEEHIFHPARYVLIEASTKAGKTVGCLAWLTEGACLEGSDGWIGTWAAPIYRQAEIAYRRFKRFVDPQLYKAKDSRLEIRILNKALLRFVGTEDPDSLFGEENQRVVMDEASRCKEESYYALRSTVSTSSGPMRLIGNVKGSKNFFYRLCRRAQKGEPGMHYAKITALDAVLAGLLPMSEVEDARRLLPKAVFDELYLAIPTVDGANPFGITAIRSCTMDNDAWARALLTTPVVWGIDLAKHANWTVLIGLNEFGQMCRFLRFQMPWRETIQHIRRVVGSTPAVIDSTGVGDPIVEFLQMGELVTDEPPSLSPHAPMSQRILESHALAEYRQRELERQTRITELRQACPSITGYLFTASSRQQALERLAVAFQNRELLIPGGKDGPEDANELHVLQLELEAFEFQYLAKSRTVRWSVPEGMTDDAAFALALAVQGRHLAVMSSYESGEIVPL